MTERTTDILIIGAGIAGAQAAETLRDGNYTGSVLVVGAEHEHPYERPALTKGVLAGAEDREDVTTLAADWWSQHDVELRLGVAVTALDADARTATLDDGDTVTYERALVATGAGSRTLDIDGSGLDGVHTVRTFDDADGLLADAREAERAVVVGGGFIGTESAGVLTAAHGVTVTQVLLEDQPLERVLGARVGQVIAQRMESRGVSIRPGASVSRIRPAKADGARTGGVELADGTTADGDLVVVAVGAVLQTDFLADSGVELDRAGGILVDEHLRTGHEGLWAAGDVAAYLSELHDGERIRVEHVEHARAQGAYVAESWLGRQDDPYRTVPFFYSDISDWVGYEVLGPPIGFDEEVVEGDIANDAFVVWYLRDGRPIAWASIGFYGDAEKATPIVERGLRGERVPREDLVSAADAE